MGDICGVDVGEGEGEGYQHNTYYYDREIFQKQLSE